MDAKPWRSNPPDAYSIALGKLVANVATLELALRVVIYLSEVQPSQRQPVARRLTALCAGDELGESALTSWDSLTALIATYNRYNPNAAVPEDIGELRDALAHGRVLTDSPDTNLRLIRFGKPRNGRVAVERIEALSIDWLDRQINRLHDAVVLVHKRMRELAPD